MPVYSFRAKCPESPYYDKDLDIYFKTHKEYEESKDSLLCPKTGCKLIKVVSKNIGVKFNGSGFYETDYK